MLRSLRAMKGLRRLGTSRLTGWLRERMPRRDSGAVSERPVRPLEEAFWNLESGPSTWRNPDCRHRGTLAVYRPLPMPVVARAPLHAIQLGHCVFCAGWVYRRTWLPWPGEESGDYPDVRPDLAHHLRRRIMSRRAEQLLADHEVLSWERALGRLAAKAPHVSRDWLPAPQALARLANQAIREWDAGSL
ncbi:hypothetical protein [Streptomyces chartreusis]|uniref:Uncharacterized protein n=1 Tax=Streptomyces chartreusis TaxID=1969 RepID=A0A7H8TMC7_STRCX|nr:hypothetical protein [Streptomyces chartreusis]QKZ24288.1 hypothetical protein HUT05_47275 [Streptomyces chartreusis]